MNNLKYKLYILIFIMNLAFSTAIHPEDGAELNYIHVLFEINQEPGVYYNNFQIQFF